MSDLSFLPPERLSELIDIVKVHITRTQQASTLLAYLLTEQQRLGLGPDMRGVLTRAYATRLVQPKAKPEYVDLLSTPAPATKSGMPDLL